MAKFMGKVEKANGESFEVPAETCPNCKGIGYLTSPLTYYSKRRGEKIHHVHRAGSGDRCPMCVGQGWVGQLGALSKP